MITTIKNNLSKIMFIYFGLHHNGWGMDSMSNDINGGADFFELMSKASEKHFERVYDFENWFGVNFKNTGFFENSLLIRHVYKNAEKKFKNIDALNIFESSRSKEIIRLVADVSKSADCLSISDIRRSYPDITLQQLPSHSSAGSKIYFSQKIKYGTMSFGFENSNEKCLNSVVFNYS